MYGVCLWYICVFVCVCMVMCVVYTSLGLTYLYKEVISQSLGLVYVVC